MDRKKGSGYVFYLGAVRARGLQAEPDKYYVFVEDKGKIFQCDAPEDAVDRAFEYRTFDHESVKTGDFVDFGSYGRFYVCGENIDSTKFLVTRHSPNMVKIPEEEFYLEKSLAVGIIGRYN